MGEDDYWVAVAAIGQLGREGSAHFAIWMDGRPAMFVSILGIQVPGGGLVGEQAWMPVSTVSLTRSPLLPQSRRWAATWPALTCCQLVANSGMVCAGCSCERLHAHASAARPVCMFLSARCLRTLYVAARCIHTL